MVAIVVVVDAVEPPAVGQRVEHILGVIDICPRIATDAAAVGVVAWEERCNRKIYPHLALCLLHDVLHTLIVRLHRRGDAPIEIGVRLIGSVSHKVQLHELISPLKELLDLQLYASAHCGVCRVDGYAAIKLYGLALGAYVDILPAVIHIVHHLRLGVAAPVGEGTPVDARLLTVPVAMLHEDFVLVRAKAEVPEGVDVNVDHAIVLKAAALEVVVDKVRHLKRLLEGHLRCQRTPAVPAEWSPTH